MVAAVIALVLILASGAGCGPFQKAGCSSGPSGGFSPPCLSIGPPPVSSGVPDESAPTWCINASDALVERLYIHLSIVIGGVSVTLPGGIGEISPARAARDWGFTNGCNMPVFTDNSTGTGSDPGGIFTIASPWNFTYTLRDLFDLWHESYSTVSVNGNAEPVSYTGAQIFNYTSNARQVVRLWVDGQVAATGSAQVLNYELSSYGTSQTVPPCFLQKYGTGHSLEITWGWVGAGA